MNHVTLADEIDSLAGVLCRRLEAQVRRRAEQRLRHLERMIAPLDARLDALYFGDEIDGRQLAGAVQAHGLLRDEMSILPGLMADVADQSQFDRLRALAVDVRLQAV